MGLACDAAVGAGVAGRFRAWDQAGLMMVLASDPALGFLSAVSGVTRETVSAAIELAGAPIWGDVRPTLVVSSELGAAAEAALTGAGLRRVADRGLAVRRLEDAPPEPAAVGGTDVIEVGADNADFPRVLLGGYEVDGTVAAFIGAEHRLPEVRRFLAMEGETPVGAAAMTIHGGVAVLGGAATLRAHRGKGAQSRLLLHRLRMAARAGCASAAATALPDSVSATNLRRAGFTVRRRPAWRSS